MDQQTFMSQKLHEFYQLKLSKNEALEVPFWDIIVITAIDEAQKELYEFKITSWQALPEGVKVHVISDPEGPKIGCGGSTLYCLSFLRNIYGEDLYKFKILIIHSGGYSQRLPNCSLGGKLFCPIPYDDHSSILDLILSSYLPFVKQMNPGVFICSSDAIITYSLDENSPECDFTQAGFTLLGHPSSIEIGLTHGVYVLDKSLIKEGLIEEGLVKVLQKPSLEEMKESEAIFENEKGENQVITDSAYYFDHSVTRSLLDLYDKNSPLTCELDAYGDFLKPLGSQNSPLHSSEVSQLQTLRELLFEINSKVKSNILFLRNSEFHHIGTMPEYIEALTSNSPFLNAFGLGGKSENPVLHSHLNSLSKIEPSIIIDNCYLLAPINAGGKSILSHLYFNDLESAKCLNFPNNCLVTTIPYLNETNSGFITVAFSVLDDIKKSVPKEELGNLIYFGKPLKELFPKPILNMISSSAACKVSLWNLGLFELHTSQSKSLFTTLKFINQIDANEKFKNDWYKENKFSLETALRNKNMKEFYSFQTKLCELLHKD